MIRLHTYFNIIFFLLLILVFGNLIKNFINNTIVNPPLIETKFNLRTGDCKKRLGSFITDNINKSKRYSYSMNLMLRGVPSETIKEIFHHQGQGGKGESFNLKYDSIKSLLILNFDEEKIELRVEQGRWFHLLVSVDIKTIDVFIDGKLVSTKELKVLPTTPGGDIMLNCGKSGPYAIINKLNVYGNEITDEYANAIFKAGGYDGDKFMHWNI